MQFPEGAPTIERFSCALDVEHLILRTVFRACMILASGPFGR
jgi:hypothetical protein